MLGIPFLAEFKARSATILTPIKFRADFASRLRETPSGRLGPESYWNVPYGFGVVIISKYPIKKRLRPFCMLK
jgi:hypothetical protein